MPPLIDGLTFDGPIVDKAFDSNALVAELNERGAKVVISQHSGCAQKRRIDTAIYTWRHLIENFFCHARLQSRPELRSHDLSRAAVVNSR